MKRCWRNEAERCPAGSTDNSKRTNQFVSILSAEPASYEYPNKRRNEDRKTSRTEPEAAVRGAEPCEVQDDHMSPEDLIAKDMKNLSLHQRAAVVEDIHGVKPQVQESASFISQCLEQLTRELRKISRMGGAYSRALFLNRRHVKDHKFEIMFLRADQFDPKKAAQRLINHFEKKLELFGHEKLIKQIRYSDLDEETIMMLEGGTSCLFPMMQDSVGRSLHIMAFKTKIVNPTSSAYARAAWYKFMTTIMCNENTQQKGMVMLFYSHGASFQDSLDNFRFQAMYRWIRQAIPIRVAAIHFCLHAEAIRPWLVASVKWLAEDVRLRTKLHYGSLLECQYELNSFGVPSHGLTIDTDGNTRYDVIHSNLQSLKLQDDHEDLVDRMVMGRKTVQIRECDVLLGKGPQCQWFPGTLAMMNIIKELKPKHDAVDRHHKQFIAAEVIRRIKHSNGRFLEQDAETGWWGEVDDKQAHTKVAMGFRNLKKKAKKPPVQEKQHT